MQASKWHNILNSTLNKCFKKVRIVKKSKKVKNDKNNILEERVKLVKESKSVNISQEDKSKIQERIKQIENEIGDKVSEDFFNEIAETAKELGNDENSIDGKGRKQLWRLLKRK